MTAAPGGGWAAAMPERRSALRVNDRAPLFDMLSIGMSVEPSDGRDPLEADEPLLTSALEDSPDWRTGSREFRSGHGSISIPEPSEPKLPKPELPRLTSTSSTP